MSSDDDKCFQCQETGYMACYCPCIRCFDCNDYGHVTAGCSNKILPSGIPARHRDNNSHTRRHDLNITIVIDIITMTIKTGTGLAGPNPIPITPDLGVTVAVTLKEVTLDPITNPHTAAHHSTEAQAHNITDKTPHTADPHHAGVSSETTVDLNHIHPTNTTTKHQQDCLPAQIEQLGKQRQEIQAGHH